MEVKRERERELLRQRFEKLNFTVLLLIILANSQNFLESLLIAKLSSCVVFFVMFKWLYRIVEWANVACVHSKLPVAFQPGHKVFSVYAIYFSVAFPPANLRTE